VEQEVTLLLGARAGGSSTVDVDQEVNGGAWYSLGSFSFDAGLASVVLSDDADGVVADAVKQIYARAQFESN
jgi:hypothetical protein